MAQRWTRHLGLLLAIPVLSAALEPASALEVRLQDGSTRVGTAERSTDEFRLHLRCGEPDAYIVQSIDWRHVAELREDDQVWGPDRFDEFRRRIAGPVNDDLVEVRLRRGRTLLGAPDRSTDVSRLRLRSGDLDAYIIYGIPWSQIHSIRDSHAAWSPDHFERFRQDLTARFANTVETEASTDRRAAAVCTEPPAPAPAPRRDFRGTVENARLHADNPRVRSVEVEATAANWDADIEWDGIVLRVRPVDEWGNLVRVAGTISATLTADMDYGWRSGTNQEFGETIRRIGCWSKVLNPDDYGLDDAVVRLEFQNYHPERPDAVGHRDHSITTHGEVSVSVAIPGHGVFNAGSGPVRLRRFSSLRDEYYQHHGTRFFPHE